MKYLQRMLRLPLFAATVLLCHGATGGEPRGNPVTELDEAKVIGKRLWQMREEMVEVEDRFYALYNQLNTNNDFDVQCGMKSWPNTLLKTRHCEVQYILKAQAAEAQAFLDGALFNESVAGGPDGADRRSQATMPADSMAIARADEYHRNMLRVINGSPELRVLIGRREKLEDDYMKARQERFKERHILFEW